MIDVRWVIRSWWQNCSMIANISEEMLYGLNPPWKTWGFIKCRDYPRMLCFQGRGARTRKKRLNFQPRVERIAPHFDDAFSTPSPHIHPNILWSNEPNSRDFMVNLQSHHLQSRFFNSEATSELDGSIETQIPKHFDPLTGSGSIQALSHVPDIQLFQVLRPNASQCRGLAGENTAGNTGSNMV